LERQISSIKVLFIFELGTRTTQVLDTIGTKSIATKWNLDVESERLKWVSSKPNEVEKWSDQ